MPDSTNKELTKSETEKVCAGSKLKGIKMPENFGKEVEVTCSFCGNKFEVYYGTVGFGCPHCGYNPSLGPHAKAHLKEEYRDKN